MTAVIAAFRLCWISCRAGGDKSHQRVTSVRDRRVSQHALDVVLSNRDDVANCHRQNCHDDERADPGRVKFDRRRS